MTPPHPAHSKHGARTDLHANRRIAFALVDIFVAANTLPWSTLFARAGKTVRQFFALTTVGTNAKIALGFVLGARLLAGESYGNGRLGKKGIGVQISNNINGGAQKTN